MLKKAIDFFARERWEIPTGPDAFKNACVYNNVFPEFEFLLMSLEPATHVRPIL